MTRTTSTTRFTRESSSKPPRRTTAQPSAVCYRMLRASCIDQGDALRAQIALMEVARLDTKHDFWP